MPIIAPTTLSGDKSLYIGNVTRDTKITIYDIKGRKIWSADVTDQSKCIQEGNYLYIDTTVTDSLADGLYIILFKREGSDPEVKKFNKISKK